MVKYAKNRKSEAKQLIERASDITNDELKPSLNGGLQYKTVFISQKTKSRQLNEKGNNWRMNMTQQFTIGFY